MSHVQNPSNEGGKKSRRGSTIVESFGALLNRSSSNANQKPRSSMGSLPHIEVPKQQSRRGSTISSVTPQPSLKSDISSKSIKNIKSFRSGSVGPVEESLDSSNYKSKDHNEPVRSRRQSDVKLEMLKTKQQLEDKYEMPKYELGSQDYLAPGETLSLNDFKLIKLIGKGGFAKVYQSVRKMDHRIFAIKVMRKDQLRQTKQSAHIMNEKSILQSSRGENFIVQLLGTFQDDIHLYMVQEFLSGGDLFGYIKLHGHLSEVHSKFYAAEILLGLEFLHEKGIVYRDLKPENILFDNHGHIKIADLGFAKQLNGGYTTTFCGTPSYLAPEVILRKPYNMMVDWWTFGVICFQLCSGCSPFQESTPPKTFSRIIHANIRWPPEPQLYFSNDVFDLIMRLFEINPKERLNGNLIKSHEWFQDIDFHDLNLRKITPPHIVHTNVRRRSISLDPNAPTELRRASTILPDHTELSAGEIPTRSTNNLFEGF